MASKCFPLQPDKLTLLTTIASSEKCQIRMPSLRSCCWLIASDYDPVTDFETHEVLAKLQRAARLLVYCGNAVWCHHGAKLDGDFPPDETQLIPLERRKVCTKCGLIGADVRPDWSQTGRMPGWGGAHR
jgi:hypothetical protein